MSGEEPSEKRSDETWLHFLARIALWAFVRFWNMKTRVSSDAKLLVRGGLALTSAGIVMLTPSYLLELGRLLYDRIATGIWQAWETPGLPGHIPGLLVIVMGAIVSVAGAYIGARWSAEANDDAPNEAAERDPDPAPLTPQAAAAWRSLSGQELGRYARSDFASVGRGQIMPEAVRTHTLHWLEILELPEAREVGTKAQELKSALERVRKGFDAPGAHDPGSDAVRASAAVGRIMTSLDLGAAKAVECDERKRENVT